MVRLVEFVVVLEGAEGPPPAVWRAPPPQRMRAPNPAPPPASHTEPDAASSLSMDNGSTPANTPNLAPQSPVNEASTEQFELPDGLHNFARPLGWVGHTPSSFPSVLTTLDGHRLYLFSFNYCTCAAHFPAPQFGENSEAGADVLAACTLVSICLISTLPAFDAFQTLQFVLFQERQTSVPRFETLASALLGLMLPEQLPFTLDLDLGTGYPAVRVEQGPSFGFSQPHELVSSLFQVLSVDTVLRVFEAALLEEKILFQSQKFTLLVYAAEALRQLLQPFDYPFVYIPVLPRALLDFVAAPTAYIIGIHSSCREDLPPLDDVNIVDLDSSSFRPAQGPREGILPQRELTLLRTDLWKVAHPAVARMDTPWPVPTRDEPLCCHILLEHLHGCKCDGFGKTVPLPLLWPPVSLSKPLPTDLLFRWCFLRFFLQLFAPAECFLLHARITPQPLSSFDLVSFIAYRKRFLRLEEHRDDAACISRFAESSFFESFLLSLRQWSAADCTYSFFLANLTQEDSILSAREFWSILQAAQETCAVFTLSMVSADSESELKVAPSPRLSARDWRSRGTLVRLQPHPVVLQPDQVLAIDHCLAALEGSDEALLVWYMHSFQHLPALVSDEACAHSLALRLEALYAHHDKNLSAFHFEVLVAIVDASLLHSQTVASVTSAYCVRFDAVASALLNLAAECYTLAGSTKSFVAQQLRNKTVFETAMFWNSEVLHSVAGALLRLYDSADINAQDPDMAALEEATIASAVAQLNLRFHSFSSDERLIHTVCNCMFTRLQISSSAVESAVSASMLRSSSSATTALEYAGPLGALLSRTMSLPLPPRVSLLPHVCASLYESEDVVRIDCPILIPSEVIHDILPDIKFLPLNMMETGFDRDQQTIDSIYCAQGTVFVTNYRIVFRGTEQRLRQHIDAMRFNTYLSLSQHAASRDVEYSVPLAAITEMAEYLIPHPFMQPFSLDKTGLTLQSNDFQCWLLAFPSSATAPLGKLLSFFHMRATIRDTFALFVSAAAELTKEAVPSTRVSSTQVRQLLATKASLKDDSLLLDDELLKHAAVLRKEQRGFRKQPSLDLPLDESADDVPCDLTGTCHTPATHAYIRDMLRCRALASGLPLSTESAREFDTDMWRLSAVNATFTLCPTAPSELCVPASITDAQIRDMSPCFEAGRVPTLTHFLGRRGSSLLRASALREGLATPGQVECFQLLTNLPSFGPPSVLDPCRHLLVSSSSSEVIESLHLGPHWKTLAIDTSEFDHSDIRKSGEFLFLATHKASEELMLSKIQQSLWLTQISNLLHWACVAADFLTETNDAVVLLCLESGSDLTPQLSTLIQILVDPFYRTLEGLISLLEKEWVAFGHNFPDRCGYIPASSNLERAPVFLQTLDAIHQLVLQFPSDFEFNTHFLESIAYHCYSARFGNFLHGNEAERAAFLRDRATRCLWATLRQFHHESPYFFNFMHKPSYDMLRPSVTLASLRLWTDFYLGAQKRAPCQFDLAQPASVLSSEYVHIAEQLLALSLSKPASGWIPGWLTLWRSLDAERTARGSWSPQPSLFQSVSVSSNDVFSEDDGQHAFSLRYLDQHACAICGSSLARSFGAKCGLCFMICHTRCCWLAPRYCRPSTLSPLMSPSIRVESVGGDGDAPTSPPRQRSMSFFSAAWTPDTALKKAGILFKVGSFVRSWKERWFEFNEAQRCLAYYVPGTRELKGTIPLSDVDEICKTNTPSLGRAFQGAFIEIVTPQRTYILQASSDDDRSSWINALNVVVAYFAAIPRKSGRPFSLFFD
eukprot:m.660453 g.660453  ORF g.660453 m.660453 type:complete len:1781 (-) comp58452_c0_seq3:40-5382(-)